MTVSGPSPRGGEGATEAAGEALAAELRARYGLSLTGSRVLAGRGKGGDDATDRWLDPRLSHLTPPALMADRDAAADRIARAIRAGERVAVFGDYDCDGITATAILTSVLETLGADVRPLLATRTEGAYGLSDPALARVLATGATLLVTCDCGSSDHERIETARRAGVDTVVIDHHLVPTEPLPAVAFLNPHRPDCGFPDKGLASCGLAFSIGAALRQRLGREKELDLRGWLDLVAIGTIADVAPLTGDNRALVRAGLRVVAAGSRPGLRALCDLAKIDLRKGVTSEDVAFRIAPRLNAPGRLGDPDAALAILMARDRQTALGLAASIEQTQVARRALQDRMVAEAHEDVGKLGLADAPALVLARQGWHPGVVGIVAGKLADAMGKPTIVIGLEGATGRGSVRGPKGFRLHDALTACRDALVGFGGHQAAAGVHVDAARVERLRDAFSDACRAQLEAAGPRATSGPDVRLEPGDDPSRVLADFERFEPFGEGNPAPVLLLEAADVVAARNLKGHLKLELSYAGRPLTGIAFGRGELADRFAGTKRSLFGALRRNTYAGGAELHVAGEVVDGPGGSSPVRW